MIKRDSQLNFLIPYIDTDLIKVLTGVRRSGKSTLLNLLQSYLIGQGIKESQFVIIDFEKLKYEPYLNHKSLYRYIEDKISINKERFYIFLDEVQEVQNFEEVLLSLRNTYGSRLDIYITSSSSKLFSKEQASLSSKSYIHLEIYPLSFSEYFKHIKGRENLDNDTSNLEYFQSYLYQGGMPFLLNQNLSTEQGSSYLLDLYNSIILKDIIEKENIRNPELLRRLINFIILNLGKNFSANSVKKHLEDEGVNASVSTILDYLAFAENAYAIIPLRRYDIQGKKLLSTQEKYYAFDHGLRQAIIGQREEDIELILENIVLIELISRGYEVYVGKTSQDDIDFVVEKNDENGFHREYIQVSHLLSSEKIREKEFKSLRDIKDNYKKTILSLDSQTRNSEGIIHQNLLDWLLS